MRTLSPRRSRTLGTVIGVALVAALGAAQLHGLGAAVPVVLGGCGLAGIVAVVLPRAVIALRRHPGLIILVALALLLAGWVLTGLLDAGQTWSPIYLTNGSPLPASPFFSYLVVPRWPWRLGQVPLWSLVLSLVCGAGGFVLVSDAVRVLIGLARSPRSRWRALTAVPTRGGRVSVRAVPGVALIVFGAFLAVGLLEHALNDAGVVPNGELHPRLALAGSLGIVALAALLVASPVAVGLGMRLNLDKNRDLRERERQRFAAHLHDSVLQTLALIQRQAADPEVVVRLARRQEHSLRAWLAGESDFNGDTVCAAIREMLAEVEDEHGVKAELTAIGDAKLDARSEELVAAAREAVRNCARHAAGAPVNVFVDIGASGTELFVRDSGPGFSFGAVPGERRGLRDAVIGRMSSVGGVATVDSSPGEGTEIALKLPAREAAR